MLGFNPTEQRSKFALEFIGTNKFILDVGCATGGFAKYFKEAGNKVYGIDINKKDLKKAKNNCDKVFNHDVTQGGLKFKSNTFDVIFAGEFIEHLDYNEGYNFLKECKRVLKDNGIVILTTLNTSFVKHRIVKTNTTDKHDHKKCYNPKELVDLVKKTGFKVIRVKGLGIMKHLIGSKFPLFFYGDIGIVVTK